MSKKWLVAMGVLVVVLIGGAVLGTGEMIYLNSEGERGWSLGVAFYALFGWDADAYREDFGEHIARRSGYRSVEGDVVVEDLPERGYGGFSRFGHGRRLGHRGGGRGFFWLLVLGGVGYYIYRRRNHGLAKATAA